MLGEKIQKNRTEVILIRYCRTIFLLAYSHKQNKAHPYTSSSTLYDAYLRAQRC
uniref:Uncharacterized protein n=1 Tax=Anopheles quadriannulatus TaxID=34691 RepID=A0A182XQW5_ANOQN